MALSPMMQQYIQTKEKYKDAILLYRLGDFYEMFFEDAEICSRVLELTLTGRDCGQEKRAPMCGIPYHAVDNYIPRLLSAGYKVAICEQLTAPKKGVKLVERDVIRVITPGTVIDSSLIKQDRNTFLMSLYKEKSNIGMAYIDISTGEFYVSEFTGDNVLSRLNDCLIRIKPSEIICNSDMFKASNELAALKAGYVPEFSLYDESNFDYSYADPLLKKQLNVNTLKAFGCANKSYAICASGAILTYINETQKRTLMHINSLEYVVNEEFMQIDGSTRRNLEISENSKDRRRHGTLLWLLDKTKTKMGQRALTKMVEQPLYNVNAINHRLKGVEELVKNIIARENIGNILYKIYDIERLCGKISYNNITPKDCVSLKNSLMLLPDLKQALQPFNSELISSIKESINTYDEIVDLLDKAIKEDAPAIIKDMGFIKEGYSPELDELNNISKSGKNWIVQLENSERESTGIKNLKISYNKVFGYYIEVLNSQKDLVPFNYIRKQTVANAERYITEELKTIEDKILHAEENKIYLEQQLFAEIRNKLLTYIVSLQNTAKSIAILDAILSLATVAVERNYCKPLMNRNTTSIEILGGRHPIVEAINKDEDFVPNDTILDSNDSRIMIITGPNMAGKSTYMRQVALITLMAHIGSFVPATSAKIALTDKIYTRVGASDDLSFGQSTFMVEMNEVSNIIRNTTNNSLIVLDEVGRGTSTFDGLSIAWSVVEYISKNLNAKTLFATHYHELTDLEGLLDGVKNYQVSIKEYNNMIIFLRKIIRGGANRSFGIEVASLAGLPKELIDRAREILHTLEEKDLNRIPNKEQLSTKKEYRNANEIINVLKDVDLNTLTPLNAFDILIQLKNYIKD